MSKTGAPGGPVYIVALGDLGRSPRMLNHALQVASLGCEVVLGGYAGSALKSAVRAHPLIRVRYLRRLARAPEGSGLVRLLLISARNAALAVWELARFLLFAQRRPEVILVQNPPAIPSLMVAAVAARARGARLIIDWHNFTFAMVRLRLRAEHPLAGLARLYERAAARGAHGHLCISEALREELRDRLGVQKAVVLYDRPSQVPPVLSWPERRKAAAQTLGFTIAPECALLVAPTSWTADERLTLLLEALDRWDLLAAKPESELPALVIAITGEGPLRRSFEDSCRAAHWRRAEIRTLFLDPAEYRNLLGACDLGLCFHESASGVDLPMKVIDLFEAGAPVCALDYGGCIREQIWPGVNGLLFRGAEELAQQLAEILSGFPRAAELERLRQNVVTFAGETWEQAWQRAAPPLLWGPRRGC